MPPGKADPKVPPKGPKEKEAEAKKGKQPAVLEEPSSAGGEGMMGGGEGVTGGGEGVMGVMGGGEGVMGGGGCVMGGGEGAMGGGEGVNERCSCRRFGSEGRVGGCRVAEVLGESKCGYWLVAGRTGHCFTWVMRGSRGGGPMWTRIVIGGPGELWLLGIKKLGGG